MSNQAAKEDEAPELSIVIPLLNEEASLRELLEQVRTAVSGRYGFEVIFVDDGSTDRSWDEICTLKKENGFVQGIRFRRNYGKSIALQKGFEIARGAYIATMDADLQDDPNEIPLMADMLREGDYDLISGWKKVRKDPITKTIPSRFFNYITSMVTRIRLHDFNCGLKVYRREVTERLTLYGELHRYIPFLADQQGFSRIGEKVVTHHPRKYGESKFGFTRFIKGFLDLITLLFLNSYMERPMHFFGTMGTLFLGAGGGITLYLVIMRMFFQVYLTNRPLLLFGILLLVLGVQFFSLGLLGEMLNKGRNQPGDGTVNIRDKV
ncbi:MAG: glycosyltransferase family 2 protein [Balneolales bacterium]